VAREYFLSTGKRIIPFPKVPKPEGLIHATKAAQNILHCETSGIRAAYYAKVETARRQREMRFNPAI
jgi:hypothetical protein